MLKVCKVCGIEKEINKGLVCHPCQKNKYHTNNPQEPSLENITPLDIQLPLGKPYQSGLLYLMIKDPEFLRLIEPELEKKHISASLAHLKLLDVIKDLYKRRGSVTLNMVKNYFIIKEYEEPVVYGLNQVIEAGSALSNADHEEIKATVFTFLKHQGVIRTFNNALDLVKEAKYDEIVSNITKACSKSFIVDEDMGVSYLDVPICDRAAITREGLWSTGFPKFDSLIEGGFAKSEIISVIAPTGMGKSALLVNFAVEAMKQDKKVLFISLEMAADKMIDRFDRVLTGHSSKELIDNPQIGVDAIKTFNNYNTTPMIKYFCPNSITVFELNAFINRFKKSVWAPDVIVVDWFGYLKMSNTYDNKHEQLSEAAMGLVAISREHNVTLLTAQQSNRSAVGMNTFNSSAVGESYGSLQGFDLVLGLGASNEDKNWGKRTLNIQKSRMGHTENFILLQGDLPSKTITYKFKEI